MLSIVALVEDGTRTPLDRKCRAANGRARARRADDDLPPSWISWTWRGIGLRRRRNLGTAV
jgi:hypothetical protein